MKQKKMSNEKKKRWKKTNSIIIWDESCNIFTSTKKSKTRSDYSRFDPIELVVFHSSLCKTMDVPYAIFSSKARLSKKTSTCAALTDFKESTTELENFCKNFREKF